ncbi:hypothetical protein TBLA_0D03100 [Henningerozyma blattae CBS 6284]|uniref:Cell division control protein n=1 Tax=Henningerozyma blattae (strain ATCC 34711 / CBS 6284 / DSM 70876 / NBRC 10599 / NRRL Y-10934 / UCD 77-7) TaxID=1071380 RepID=I2H358_HENB6|nr:hypothetical protein TBLA_0D03100 [Tetrapisispora blattae CBS 6284]CCH60810.1 hypothetical protein TBLA_0D03100 [Tetrapisispora blattae CBS 6284]
MSIASRLRTKRSVHQDELMRNDNDENNSFVVSSTPSKKRKISSIASITPDKESNESTAIYTPFLKKNTTMKLPLQNITPINNRILSPPLTPQSSTIKHLTRKNLQNEIKNLNDNDQPIPATPEKPKKFKLLNQKDKLNVPTFVLNKDSIYSKTKAILQRSSGLWADDIGVLPTRNVEYTQISSFLRTNIVNNKSNSLYITGPPGTGKTAQLNSILNHQFIPTTSPHNDLKNIYKFNTNPDDENEFKYVAMSTINCISFNDPSSIFNRIYNEFNKVQDVRSVHSMHDLQTFMESHSKDTAFIIFLDELDNLTNMNQASKGSNSHAFSTKILFELFLLAKQPSINFILLGVSNSLDMTDRFLTRLNLKTDLLPKTINFYPYNAEQLFEIIMNRLSIVDAKESIFNPMAIRFAAKKISSNSGDLRKLFDILRNSIELLELETLAQSRMSNSKEANTTKPIVSLQHIAKVFTNLNSNKSTRSKINKLNMQQKLVLCALMHRENTDIFQSHCTIDDSFQYYIKLMNRQEISPLKRSEYLEICNALESNSSIEIIDGRSSGKLKTRIKLIRCRIDNKEFIDEMSKFDILKRFL